ncbi:TetR/AcrR family transcriptional regulator [Amycolatopsis acidiphila]|uniref:TetR/AcrR family transcriptional regulator n=1 Tax=Amycolatopsis acidiphila TaxID=715473 RepID=A0A558AE30_9PSEU|nr:TetR/AcrR family transcriptional regulator [Amycolatopsis acidiphila]TVT22515.1 TetR/AcrR family transcriptional regulator [Amycolatopsis acidiphila]UIJ58849.1 TetR/AcrR family transcriptional regulator [Amycolatopsis acidiphila]GHG72346.1 TetR family transcriptional regulator [Amycolatopsis acidiphila]
MQEPRTRRTGDRKNQLATIAAELFRARGYHGVGINDIAAAAGITGPALYRHFADKQAVLAYVLLSGVRDMETETTAALSTMGRPSGEQVDQLLAAIASASVERREVAALWRWEGKHLSPADQREIGRRSSAILTAWAKVLLEVRPELAAADAELLCWAALSVFGSVSVHHTTVAKRRFVQLLSALAKRVLSTDLPPAAAAPVPAPAAGIGTPSRREQLLSAATELFRQRGFHDVSMEDIGAAAGIAGPSVYRHFPSKTSLIHAIARRTADRLALAVEEVLRNSADELEALRCLVSSYVQVLTGSAELAVTFTIDGVNLAERDRAELLRIQRDYVAQWVSLLCTVHPGLNAREAKITVHAALTIANDLARTRRINARPNLPGELETLLQAVLDLR